VKARFGNQTGDLSDHSRPARVQRNLEYGAVRRFGCGGRPCEVVRPGGPHGRVVRVMSTGPGRPALQLSAARSRTPFGVPRPVGGWSPGVSLRSPPANFWSPFRGMFRWMSCAAQREGWSSMGAQRPDTEVRDPVTRVGDPGGRFFFGWTPIGDRLETYRTTRPPSGDRMETYRTTWPLRGGGLETEPATGAGGFWGGRRGRQRSGTVRGKSSPGRTRCQATKSRSRPREGSQKLAGGERSDTPGGCPQQRPAPRRGA
jgi:hypothetical protein